MLYFFAFYAIYIFELKDAKALPIKNYKRGVLKNPRHSCIILTSRRNRFSLPLIYFLILMLFSEGVKTNTVFPYLCIYSSLLYSFYVYPTFYYCSLAQVCVVSINHQLKAGNRCLGNEMISCVKQ